MNARDPFNPFNPLPSLRVPKGRSNLKRRDCFVASLLAMTAGGAFLFLVLQGRESTVLAGPLKIRVGHFPTITHAPALIGRATRHFEKAFEGEAEIEWRLFNAGSLALEALFANTIDLLYVGPNPAINGFVRSQGEALRVVAGVASGGAALVVRKDSRIQSWQDLQGRRLATPQIGNSQDVALRSFLRERGLRPRSEGGDVEIFRLEGGDQITALARGEVDGIWTVEPWVTRLAAEAHGRILFEEKELWPGGRYATALLVVRKKFLDEHPEIAEKWVQAHQEIIHGMEERPEEAKRILNEELKRETGKIFPEAYVDSCFGRITFTTDPMENSVRSSAERAQRIGYLGSDRVDLTNLYELSFLREEGRGGRD